MVSVVHEFFSSLKDNLIDFAHVRREENEKFNVWFLLSFYKEQSQDSLHYKYDIHLVGKVHSLKLVVNAPRGFLHCKYFF